MRRNSLFAALLLAVAAAGFTPLRAAADELHALIFVNTGAGAPGAAAAGDALAQALRSAGATVRVREDADARTVERDFGWLEDKAFTSEGGALFIAALGPGSTGSGPSDRVLTGGDGAAAVAFAARAADLASLTDATVTVLVEGPVGPDGWIEVEPADNVLYAGAGVPDGASDYRLVDAFLASWESAGEFADLRGTLSNAAEQLVIDSDFTIFPRFRAGARAGVDLPVLSPDREIEFGETRALGTETRGRFGRRMVKSVGPIRFEKPDPDPPAGPRIVRLLFGTTRRLQDVDPSANLSTLVFTSERQRQLQFGAVAVTVPNVARDYGEVLRPCGFPCLTPSAEDPKKHFTIAEANILSDADFERLRAILSDGAANFAGQALVFVHGFNTSFEGAAYRTAQIVHDLEFDAEAYFFSWPSKAELSAGAYNYDLDSVEFSEPYLVDFLRHIRATTTAERVHVIAHSMGGLLTMKALDTLRAEDGGRGPEFGELILAAPDVDRDVFLGLAEAVRANVSGVTLYASANDVALRASSRFRGGPPRAGQVPAGGDPVVAEGLDSIDVSAVQPKVFGGLNHSSYAEAEALIDDLAELLRAGPRQAPDARLGDRVRTIEVSDGVFYRMR